jgi:hypothetical protein
MRKRSLPVTIALVLTMLFAVGLPSVSAQSQSNCYPYNGPIGYSHFFAQALFSAIGENHVITLSSPTFPDELVVVRYLDFDTGDVISESVENLPITLSTANGSAANIEVFTDSGNPIDLWLVVTCGEELLSCPIDDGRLDTTDCGALVAAYPNGTALDIYGIDPVNGEGVLVFSFDLATAGDVTENTLLAEGTNPFNGQPIQLYKLTGGYQLNSTQPNGEPYEFSWS